MPQVLLPIGISFFIFHAISYVVDVYRGDAAAQKSPVHAALYLLLFPQLIAGPIIRYRDIADQLARRVVTLDDFAYGVRRFVIGLGKKMLVANIVAVPADQIFAMPAGAAERPRTPGSALVCYTLQIYFDFSGYSDMAIGLGRMFGFRFPENFRWPYVADSPCRSSGAAGTSRSPPGSATTSTSRSAATACRRARMYLNLVTVFFLCGLWHGASWNFVVWGLFHGAFLVAERAGLASAVGACWRPLRHAYLLGRRDGRLGVLPGRHAAAARSTSWQALAGRGATAPAPYTLAWYLTPELVSRWPPASSDRRLWCGARDVATS